MTAKNELETVDMISQQELITAMAAKTLVDARVEHVARYIANVSNDLRDIPVTRWNLQSYSLSANSRTDGEPVVYVTLEVLWDYRVATAKYGDPLNDEEFSENVFSTDKTIQHRLSFPQRYLTTNDWVSEVEQKAAKMALWYRERDIKRVNDAISEHYAGIASMSEKLAVLMTDQAKLHEKLPSADETHA